MPCRAGQEPRVGKREGSAAASPAKGRLSGVRSAHTGRRPPPAPAIAEAFALHYDRHTNASRLPVFEQGDVSATIDEPTGSSTPETGGTYAVWSKSLKRFLHQKPFVCVSREQDGDVVRVNFDGSNHCCSPKLIIRKDLEATNAADLCDPDMPATAGSDLVFIPVEADCD